jgi:hypothetical protein
MSGFRDTTILLLLLILALIFATLSLLSPTSSSPIFASPLSPSASTKYPPKLSEILQTLAPELSRYPTDLTKDIYPKPIHSHNDYWRTAPLFSALAMGAASIEADVWLHDDALYIGHEPSALTKDRTLQSLYIRPLVEILTRLNPESDFVQGNTTNGVYDVASFLTLFLWIDIKTDGDVAWPVLLKELEPLRKRNWLSYVHDGKLVERPVTIIGTGNTPLQKVIESVDHREVLYDAHIDLLDRPGFDDLTPLVAPFASGQYGAIFQPGPRGKEGLEGEQLGLLKSQIRTAHDRGIKVRYWDTPAWPKSTREGVWRQLWEEGVDLVNADALDEIANGSW